jgi:hypothetical protein
MAAGASAAPLCWFAESCFRCMACAHETLQGVELLTVYTSQRAKQTKIKTRNREEVEQMCIDMHRARSGSRCGAGASARCRCQMGALPPVPALLPVPHLALAGAVGRVPAPAAFAQLE